MFSQILPLILSYTIGSTKLAYTYIAVLISNFYYKRIYFKDFIWRTNLEAILTDLYLCSLSNVDFEFKYLPT